MHYVLLVKHVNIKRNSVLNIPMTVKNQLDTIFYLPLQWQNINHRCIGTTAYAKAIASVKINSRKILPIDGYWFFKVYKFKAFLKKIQTINYKYKNVFQKYSLDHLFDFTAFVKRIQQYLYSALI